MIQIIDCETKIYPYDGIDREGWVYEIVYKEDNNDKIKIFELFEGTYYSEEENDEGTGYIEVIVNGILDFLEFYRTEEELEEIRRELRKRYRDILEAVERFEDCTFIFNI